jgi:creatinine amidohydrolase
MRLAGTTACFNFPRLRSDVPTNIPISLGTVSISATTLAAVVVDISRSLRQQDVNALIVVNGHGGNYVLANVAQEVNADNAIQVGLYPSRDDWTEARHAAGITSNNHDDMHAGELETSVLLAAHPAYLRDGWQSSDHTASDRRYLTTLGVSAYTASGIIGYPSRADAEKGQMVLNHLGHAAGKLITLLTVGRPNGSRWRLPSVAAPVRRHGRTRSPPRGLE